MKMTVENIILTIILANTFVCRLKIHEKLENNKKNIYILTIQIKTFFRLKLHIPLSILQVQLLEPYFKNIGRGILGQFIVSHIETLFISFHCIYYIFNL